jgi:hypothetical protein
MIPSLVATELQGRIREFLRTTFPATTPGFLRPNGRTMLDDFLAQPDVLFKGPYLSLGLPFRTAPEDATLPFERITPGSRPYRHQLMAFRRLCGAAPQATLEATGTGSGKTQCFLYPILDYYATADDFLVAENLARFWREKLGDEAFVATFLAPNLEWLRDWEQLRHEGALPDGSDLVEHWVQRRMDWEVVNELGLGSRIGRTLERTGRATVAVDAHALERAVESALPRLQANIGALRELDASGLRGFLVGLLWRLRTQGAFFHPFLKGYLESGGREYQIGRLHFMPGYGKAVPPRKRGNLHGAEAMTNGIEQGVEHRLQNHAIRLDGVRVDGPQYGRGTHAPAEEEDVAVRQPPSRVAHGRGSIFRFVNPNGRVGFRRPARTSEIDKQHGRTEIEERPRLA